MIIEKNEIYRAEWRSGNTRCHAILRAAYVDPDNLHYSVALFGDGRVIQDSAMSIKNELTWPSPDETAAFLECEKKLNEPTYDIFG